MCCFLASRALCRPSSQHAGCCRSAGEQRCCLCGEAHWGLRVCTAGATHFAPCARKSQCQSRGLLCWTFVMSQALQPYKENPPAAVTQNSIL